MIELLGGAGPTSVQASTSMSAPRDIEVGELIVVAAGWRNTTVLVTQASISDSSVQPGAANVYRQDRVSPGTTTSHAAASIYSCLVTRKILAGNQITVTPASSAFAFLSAYVIPNGTQLVLASKAGASDADPATGWDVGTLATSAGAAVGTLSANANVNNQTPTMIAPAPWEQRYIGYDAPNGGGQQTSVVHTWVAQSAVDYDYDGAFSVAFNGWRACVVVFEVVEPPPLGAYKDEVLADTPIGYYRCEEASGNPQDSSGNGKNANSVAGTIQYRQPSLLRSDPTSYAADYLTATVNVPGLPLIGNVFSLELWLKKGSSGSYQEIFQKGNLDGFTFRFMPDGRVELVRSGIVNIGNSSISVTDAQTHHVVCTRAGGGAGQTKIYVDGVDVSASMAVGDIITQNIDLSIGRGGIDATFDELALYDYALSTERVLAHYNAGLVAAPSLTTPPVLFGEPVWNGKLAVSNGEWAGTAPITFTYEWDRSADGVSGWAIIPGATNSSYLQTQDDVGQFIRCVVTATNAGGSPFASSNNVGPVVDGKETWVHLESRVNYPPASSWTQIKAGAVYPGGNTSWVEVEAAIGEGGGEEVTSYGTTLPGAPADGDTHILVDSLTAATYQWEFRYNAARATNKWEFVGGAPGYAEVLTEETTSSLTYVALATAGPNFIVPVAGDYLVSIGCVNPAVAGGGRGAISMSYDIGATGAVDADRVRSFGVESNSQANQSVSRTMKKSLTAVTLTSKYRNDAGSSQSAASRWLQVVPIAVGG